MYVQASFDKLTHYKEKTKSTLFFGIYIILYLNIYYMYMLLLLYPDRCHATHIWSFAYVTTNTRMIKSNLKSQKHLYTRGVIWGRADNEKNKDTSCKINILCLVYSTFIVMI
jgi:hypothetical protein